MDREPHQLRTETTNTNTMKHNYTDTQLQAAIDEACNKINEEHKDVGGLLILDPEDNRWRNEKPARLDLIKSALAALPEPIDEESMLLNLLAVIHRDGGHYQVEHGTRKAVADACKEWQRLISIVEKTVLTEPPTVDGKTPGQVAWDAGNEVQKRKFPNEPVMSWQEGYELHEQHEAAASAVLAAFGKQSQPTEIPWIEWHGGECPLKDEEVKEWEYKLRDGFTICHPEKPRLYAWSHNKSSNDIIAYRVLKWRAGFGPVDWKAKFEALESQWVVAERAVDNVIKILPELKKSPSWEDAATLIREYIDSANARAEKAEAEIAEHKALTADEWAARWQDEVDARNRQYNELECTRAIAEKALTELAKTKENAPPQLRPLAEAGEVPEGCVRYYTYKKDGEWTTKSKYRAMQDTHYIDFRLPEPEPLVTKPISLPEWTPQVGDVVTLKSGGAKMTVVKLADGEGGLLAFLCEWFSDSGEYDSGVIYLTSLQPA